ncbi:hepatoma-derived growth factor-related protein 2-like [Anopheles bellator]|uniref:hepatoma-derived growth factor-related protein 2-like n=1 Tax=Anopheles bellator TaxID=139047 RepID=UPI0026487A68|nr:hepatoma-derived growth factor-related protein 2-like [Anopheles bellator]
MVASKKSFNIGDLVFAKVKGYPPWPAKITRIDKSKYNVYFYGTGETANIKVEDLFPYEESKGKFATDKIMRRKGFKEAMLQIEAALSGEDPSPLSFDVVAVQSGVDDYAMRSDLNEPSFSDSRISANSTVLDTSTTQRENDDVHNDSDMKIAKESKSSTTKKTMPVTAATVPAIPRSTPPTVANNGAIQKEADAAHPDAEPVVTTAEAKEVVSRSGRKIKMKRFMDGDDEESASLGPPAKKKAPNVTSVKDKAPATPAGTGITTKKSSVFDKIEKERVYFLKLEREIVQLNMEVKASVKLARADAERCVRLLEQYQKLEVTPIILLKHPNCVETMKRLRKYVGNAKAWNMPETEQVKFDFYAQQIRAKAEQIYNRFKTIFSVPENNLSFWEWFQQKVAFYQREIEHLTPEERHMIIDDADVPKQSETGNRYAKESDVKKEDKTETTDTEESAIVAEKSNDVALEEN